MLWRLSLWESRQSGGFQLGLLVRLLQRDWGFMDLFFRDLAIVGYCNEYLLIQLLSFKF